MILYAYNMYRHMNSFNRQIKLVDGIVIACYSHKSTSVWKSRDVSGPPWPEAPQLPIGSKTFDSGTRQCRLNGARAAPRPVIRIMFFSQDPIQL